MKNTLLSNDSIHLTSPNNIIEKNKFAIDWLMLTVSVIFTGALAVWFHFDHNLPLWDAASHVQDSAKYCELFRHFRPWQPEWMHSFLTENFNYPITVHAFTGLVMAIFGVSAFSTDLSLLIFSFVLNLSIYSLVQILYKDKVAAVLAVLFLNAYPCTSTYSHLLMLDFQHLSLHCMAVLALFWWYKQPTWRKAVIAGVAFSCAVTSKQVATFFFAVPCLLLWFMLLVQKKKSQLAQLTMIGAMGLSALAIWVIPNLKTIKEFSAALPKVAGQAGQNVFFHNLLGFISQIPEMMSPLLFIAFFAALLICANKISKFSFHLLGSVSGTILLSFVACQNPESRYLITILLYPAIATGLAISLVWKSKIKLLQAAGALLVAYALLQFVAYNYFPYPLSQPYQLLSKVCNLAGCPVNADGLPKPLVPISPTPPGDLWGQEWVISQIEQIDKGKICWLNVMPSTAEINVHTLELSGLYSKSRIRPSTFRYWSLVGDRIDYSEQKIGYFSWYLFKTGDQGLRLKDKESELNYNKIESYVRESGRFYLCAKRTVNDGSEISLYRVK